MGTTAHIDFIAAAYAAAAIVIGALILWVAVDYRTERRKIAELERQGFTRRSASDRPLRQPSQKQQAKEEA
ncbi:MAG: heme exporter protein CcmD [Xanthobacteraceae bacterium]